MAELYAMPIEIFEYTVTPARVFNKEKTRRAKYGLFLRLSYHSKNHYNAVVPANKSKRTAIYSQEPGMIENQRITLVMANMDYNDVPADFEQNMKTSERSRESILFEEDMMAALMSSRDGFEHRMTVVESPPMLVPQTE